MTTQSARIRLTAEATVVGTANALGSSAFSPSLNKLIELANGTGANQSDVIYAADRTVTAASNDDIDLAGVLATPFGNTITFVEIVGIIIYNQSSSQTLTIGNEGTNAWETMLSANGTIKVGPGGLFCNIAPGAAGLGAVTPATGDKLRIANDAGSSCTYSIIVLGRSA